MPLHGNLEASSIYISLNSRAQTGSYHWGLVLTDLHTKAVLHHASNRLGPWTYEEKPANLASSVTLIALVLVDKFKSHARTKEVIKGIPADGSPSQRTGESFSCGTWAKDVLMSLHECGEIVLPKTLDELAIFAVETGLKYAPTAERGGGATVINDYA